MQPRIYIYMRKMSTKDDNPPVDPKPEDLDPEVKRQIITVERGKEAEELKIKLEEEQKEKERLNEELRTLHEQLTTLQNSDKTKTEEFDSLKTKYEENENTLLEIANTAYERKKEEYFTVIDSSGLDPEKIQELKDGIQTPEDLDNAEIYLTLIPSLLKKAQMERETGDLEKQQAADLQKIKDDASAKDSKVGGGVVQLDSSGNKTGEYNTYREAIDDLYEKWQKGDEQAGKDIEGLWKLVIPKLKSLPIQFSMSECPRCRHSILEGESCFYCGFNPATDYIQARTSWG